MNKWDHATAIVIAASRREVKVSQAQLAEKMGWQPSIITKIENRKREVTVAEFIVIAEALGFDPEVLFARILQWVKCWEAFTTGRPLSAIE